MQEESRELESADINSEQDKNAQCDDGMKFSLKDGITIYEGKIATIIVSSISTLMFSLVMYYFRQDISDNLTYIVTTFIYCLAGVTTAEKALSTFKNWKSSKK